MMQSTARVPVLSLLVACGLACGPGDTSGFGPEVVRSAVVDWSFAEDLELASLQTSSPPRSRAVWVLVHDGELYISTGIARRAQWPRQLQADPVVLLRLEDRLYLRSATWVTDTTERATLREAVREKYGAAPRGDDESGGFFRMDAAPAHG